MQHGICQLSVIGCHREASRASEMVTQLLFGEHYTVLEQTESWLRIKTAYDNYECWISAAQHSRILPGTFERLQQSQPVFCNELIHPIQNKLLQLSFPITMGATLPFFSNGTCSFESSVFGFDGTPSAAGEKKNASHILSTAYCFLNAPYLWGGKSPLGIDCSGFAQLVYKLNGYKLPRDSQQQVELGYPLSFVEEAEAGDLAFFDNEEGNIVHVGILLDAEQIIHASGAVRVDKLDHYGIYSAEDRKYTHTLRVIKRIL